MSSTTVDEHPEVHHEGPEKGLLRWVFTTNHKDIGTLYLFFSLMMFFTGGTMAMLIRAELFMPGMQIVDPYFFNQLTTMHGLIMIFGVIMPAFVGLANWQVPMMVGAPDMALPRLNNWSFWLLPFAFTLLLSGFFMPGGALAGGWTMYVPLNYETGQAFPFSIFAIHMAGMSSILGAINIIATSLNMRPSGMTLMRLPLFVWSWVITAFLLIAVMPVLAGVVTMQLVDQYFNASFFDAAGGGGPVMYQHIFWFFGHPEVYIMILPAFGIVSQIIPTFARKPLFGYTSMVLAVASIAFLSFVVWAHHMFTTGMPLGAELYFMFATMLIAIPTAVKVFNWTATMWKGSMTFETPMLWAIAFVVLFACGGFSGLMLALAPVDFQYQETYFVVAHFHYVLVTGSAFAIMGAVYYWLPKWTGHMYDERLGKLHFWLTCISANVLYFPQHFVGLAGMPRRIPDYSYQFVEWNMVSSIGGFVFGLSQLLFVYIIMKTIRGGVRAKGRAWEGAYGMEWELPSPAPYHSFQTPPDVDDVPLDIEAANGGAHH